MNIFSREGQVKTMETTVSHTEKFLGEFCSLLASYTRKTAKLRDKADLLATQMLQYANTEDQETRTALKNLAEDLAMVQDYRQAKVERLETRVVGPLKAYGDIVKSKRADLKRFSAERNRELKELQKLEKLRQRNPADRQVIAEVSAQKATNNAQRSTRQLEDTIIDFQRQKLEDVKKIFTDFITVEMIFHAKALEVFSHTFQNLECVDIDKDMEVFTGRVRVSDPLDNMPLLSSSSLAPRSPSPLAPRASSSLPPHASTGSPLRRTADTARRAHPSTLRRQRGVEEEEEEEEEEDEEEEEEEMYESEIEEVHHSPRLSYAAQYSQIHRKHK